MDITKIITMYICGLCEQKCMVDAIPNHPCIQGYDQVVLTDSNHFYPQIGGEIIGKETQRESCDTSIKEINKENTDINNDNSAVTIASMEEILIAAVQERPPLWNYKDVLPSQRTKAIKDKLWQEIENLLNTNKEKKQYTIAILKMKWKNLYDTYRTNIAKEKGKSGQAAKKSKPWRFMKQMSFLKDTFDLGIRNTITNLTLPTLEDTLFNDDLHFEDSNLHTSSDDNTSNKGTKKRKTDDAFERIANLLSEPIPPPPTTTFTYA